MESEEISRAVEYIGLHNLALLQVREMVGEFFHSLKALIQKLTKEDVKEEELLLQMGKDSKTFLQPALLMGGPPQLPV